MTARERATAFAYETMRVVVAATVAVVIGTVTSIAWFDHRYAAREEFEKHAAAPTHADESEIHEALGSRTSLLEIQANNLAAQAEWQNAVLFAIAQKVGVSITPPPSARYHSRKEKTP